MILPDHETLDIRKNYPNNKNTKSDINGCVDFTRAIIYDSTPSEESSPKSLNSVTNDVNEFSLKKKQFNFPSNRYVA